MRRTSSNYLPMKAIALIYQATLSSHPATIYLVSCNCCIFCQGDGMYDGDDGIVGNDWGDGHCHRHHSVHLLLSDQLFQVLR